MKYLSFFFLSILLMVQLVSCRHTYSPILEYRESKAYNFGLNPSISSFDTVPVGNLLIASGVLTMFKLDEQIPLNHSRILEVVSSRLSHCTAFQSSNRDSLEIVLVDKFAFNDPWNKKLDFQKLDYRKSQECQLIPYVEYSVRTALENEGGGGMESTVRTDNRIHNITQGFVLTMFCKGEQVFSSGHYITDMYIDHKDSVTVYDFSMERLDSLMGLCLGDLEKEIKAAQERLK